MPHVRFVVLSGCQHSAVCLHAMPTIILVIINIITLYYILDFIYLLSILWDVVHFSCWAMLCGGILCGYLKVGGCSQVQ